MRVLFMIAFTLLSNLAIGQLEPVKWSFDVEQVSDKEYNIIFTADIDRGWSVYSQFMESQKGPIPTTFEFYRDSEIELIGDASEAGHKQEIFDEIFGMTLIKYKGKARFVQRVKVDNATELVKGHLTYMTCDDNSCLPPEDVNFEIALR